MNNKIGTDQFVSYQDSQDLISLKRVFTHELPFYINLFVLFDQLSRCEKTSGNFNYFLVA